jgi:hypothetical protein
MVTQIMHVMKAFRDSFVVSFVFFLASNFFVFIEGLLYPPTIDGFLRCYIMAIPFFWNKLSYMTLFTSLFIRLFIFGKKRLSWGFVDKRKIMIETK